MQAEENWRLPARRAVGELDSCWERHIYHM
jgi:hypothetical protein